MSVIKRWCLIKVLFEAPDKVMMTKWIGVGVIFCILLQVVMHNIS